MRLNVVAGCCCADASKARGNLGEAGNQMAALPLLSPLALALWARPCCCLCCWLGTTHPASRREKDAWQQQ